jgi:hypothetical protein
MAIRVRFDITWTVTLKADGIFSTPEGFLDIAQVVCVDGFAKHDPQLNTRHTLMEGGRVAFHMLWDVDLADTAGACFDDPNDHVAHLQKRLATHLGAEMDVQIWRKAEFSEAIDHEDILAFHGSDASSEDYPVFRPEPHPEWEAADEVFMFLGCWHWSVSDEMAEALDLDHFESRGPSAGPDPEAIYALWEDDFLDRHRASEARNAEVLARLAGCCVAA